MDSEANPVICVKSSFKVCQPPCGASSVATILPRRHRTAGRLAGGGRRGDIGVDRGQRIGHFCARGVPSTPNDLVDGSKKEPVLPFPKPAKHEAPVAARMSLSESATNIDLAETKPR